MVGRILDPWWRRLRIASLVLVCLARLSLGKKGHHEGAWHGAHHSFDGALTYDDNLDDWLVSGSTMAFSDRVLLFPNISDRHGLFWNKKAIKSRDYEVVLTLSTHKSAPRAGADSAVAFWLSLEDFPSSYSEKALIESKAPTWEEGLRKLGLELLGNKANFKGLLVAFLGEGHCSSSSESVAVTFNSGDHAHSLSSLCQPLTHTVTPTAWKSHFLQMRVRMMFDGGVVGEIRTLDLEHHLTSSIWVFAQSGSSTRVTGMFRLNVDGTLRWEAEKLKKPLSGTWKLLPGHKVKLKMQQSETIIFQLKGTKQMVRLLSKKKTGLGMELIAFRGSKEDAENPHTEEPWMHLFKLPSGTVPESAASAGTWMGVSGWSGKTGQMEVAVLGTDLTNFDMSSMGEDESGLLASDEMKAWQEALEEEKRYTSQASQTEALLRLSKLLADHVERYDQLGNQLSAEVVRLDERLDNLGQDIATWVTISQAWDTDKLELDPSAVRGHITSIKSLLTHDRERHDTKLLVVHEAAKQLKASHGNSQNDAKRAKVQAVAKQAQAVEDSAASGAFQTFTMLLVLVGCVCILGLLFLNRMRYYEKKHYI